MSSGDSADSQTRWSKTTLIKIVTATDADLEYVAEHMVKEDRDEIWAASGLTPLEGLRNSANMCGVDTYAVCPVLDGGLAQPVAIFGIAADPSTVGVGIMWMLTTKMLLTTSKDILRQAPSWFRKWLEKYPKGLHNVIDIRNQRHMKWLDKMGCKFENRVHLVPTPEGVSVPFMHFSYVKAA